MDSQVECCQQRVVHSRQLYGNARPLHRTPTLRLAAVTLALRCARK